MPAGHLSVETSSVVIPGEATGACPCWSCAQDAACAAANTGSAQLCSRGIRGSGQRAAPKIPLYPEHQKATRLETGSLQAQQVETGSLRAQQVEMRSLREQQVETLSLQVQQVETGSLQAQQVEMRSLQAQQVETGSLREQQVEMRSLRVQQVETGVTAGAAG